MVQSRHWWMAFAAGLLAALGGMTMGCGVLSKFTRGSVAGVESPASEARTARYAGPECEKVVFFGRSRDANKAKKKMEAVGESEGAVLLSVCPWHERTKKGNRRYQSNALVELPSVSHVRAELNGLLADPIRSALYVLTVSVSMKPEDQRGYLGVRRLSGKFESKGPDALAPVLGVARVLLETFDGAAIEEALGPLGLPPGAVKAFVAGYQEAGEHLKSVVATLTEAERKFYVDAALDVQRERASPHWTAFDALAKKGESAPTAEARRAVIGELTALRAQVFEACGARAPIISRGTTRHPHDCIATGLYSAMAEALTALHLADGDPQSAAAEVVVEASFGIGRTPGWEPHIHFHQKKYLSGFSGSLRTTRSVDKFYRLGGDVEKKHRKALPLQMVRERVVGTKKEGEYVRLKLKRPKDYRCANWQVDWTPYSSVESVWTFAQHRMAGEGKIVNGVPMVEKNRRCTKILEIKGQAQKKVSSLLFSAKEAADIRKHDYIWFVCTAFKRQEMANTGTSYCLKSEQTHSQIIAAFRPQCRPGYTLAKKLGKGSRLVCTKKGQRRPAFRVLRQVRSHFVKADFSKK